LYLDPPHWKRRSDRDKHFGSKFRDAARAIFVTNNNSDDYDGGGGRTIVVVVVFSCCVSLCRPLRPPYMNGTR